METKKVVSVFLVFVLLASLTFVIAEESESEGETPMNYGQCVRIASHDKNACYKEARTSTKEAYETCREEAPSVDPELRGDERREALKERRDALKTCREVYREGYREAKQGCKDAFKTAKETCEENKENSREKSCTGEAAEAKNECYKVSKETYAECKDAVEPVEKGLKGQERKDALEVMRNALNACKDGLKEARETCREDFKTAKEACETEETEEEPSE